MSKPIELKTKQIDTTRIVHKKIANNANDKRTPTFQTIRGLNNPLQSADCFDRKVGKII